MKRSKIFVIATLLAGLNVTAYADINVVNHTNAYVTGSVNFSPCSSTVGDDGVVNPQQTKAVPEYVMNMFCGKNICDVNVFMSKNCSGKKVATVKVNPKNGGSVISINNLDKDHFTLSGSGQVVTIDAVSNGFKGWFNSLF